MSNPASLDPLVRFCLSVALLAPPQQRQALFALTPKNTISGPYYALGRFFREDSTTNTLDVQAVARKAGIDPVELAGLYGLDETYRPLSEHLIRLLSARQAHEQNNGGDVVPWALAIAEIYRARQLADASPAEPRESLFECADSFLTTNIVVEYLIHKRLEVSTLISITGPSGQYKSFVAISIACHIACGLPWNGLKVKQGAVLYLAGEGRSGIIRRVKAWMINNGLKPSALDHLYLSRSTLMMDGCNIGQIVEEMKGVDVVLIIVDTLARHISGHENDALDMGSFVNHVDALKYRLGAAAIVVHHTGHQDQTRGRGSSTWRAALDTEIICDRGVLKFTKCKDSEAPENIEFKLAQVVIGADEENGEPITSAVVEYGERSAKNREASLTANERQLLGLVNCYPNILVGDLRNVFYDKRREIEPDAKQNTLKKAFLRALDGLLEKEMVHQIDNIIKTGHGTTTGHLADMSREDETGQTGHPSLEGVPMSRSLSPPEMSHLAPVSDDDEVWTS